MNLMERHPEYDSNRLTKPSEKRMQAFRVYDVTYDDRLTEVDFLEVLVGYLVRILKRNGISLQMAV